MKCSLWGPMLAVLAIAFSFGLTGCDDPLGPDGSIGYDEGARLAIYAQRFAEKFRKSSDDTAEFVYTPKYGNDQAIKVAMSAGGSLPSGKVQGAAVTVFVGQGKSGTGYALGRNAGVPVALSVEKQRGPIRIELKKVQGVVQVVGIQ